MTYGRAATIAILAVALNRAYPDPGASLVALGLCWLLWGFTSDPIPDAVRKGLEDFARRHRR